MNMSHTVLSILSMFTGVYKSVCNGPVVDTDDSIRCCDLGCNVAILLAKYYAIYIYKLLVSSDDYLLGNISIYSSWF